MYFLSKGNGTPFITYKLIALLSYIPTFVRFQEQTVYKSQGLPVLTYSIKSKTDKNPICTYTSCLTLVVICITMPGISMMFMSINSAPYHRTHVTLIN